MYRLMLSFVLVMSLVWGASAEAAPRMNGFESVSVTPTDVIGLGEFGTCGEGGVPVVASHDRGATVSQGACLASSDGTLLFDAVTGLAHALDRVVGTEPPFDSTTVLRTFDRDGGIAATRPVPVPDGANLGVVNGGDLFVFRRTYDDPPAAVAMARYLASGGESACGLPPARTERFVSMPGGVLLALATSGGQPELIAISNDACQSWSGLPANPPGECFSVRMWSPVRAYLSCFAPGAADPSAYALDYAAPGAWKPAGVDSLAWDFPDGTLDVFLPADESQIRIEPDDLGHPGWPAGWATPQPLPRAGTAPPAAAAKVFDYINQRFRRPMGLPDIGWSDLAAKAAQNHADYFAANGYSGHDEVKNKPKFTGAAHPERCAAVGLRDGCGSEIVFGEPNLLKAVKGWLATPYHAPPMLGGASIGFGWSKKGAVGVTGPRGAGAQTITIAAPPNTPGAAIRSWPADGMTNVPTTWWGAESPDPLEFYKGNHKNIGPAFFLATEQRMTLTLRKAGTKALIPLLEAGHAKALKKLPLVSSYGGTSKYFPARRLKPKTRYVLEGKVADRTVTFTFKTAKRATSTA